MNLSTEQKAAVTTLDRDVCLTAGAGTGKTTVLVERFYTLIHQKQVSASQILAITFTEKAATEMRERLETMLKDKIRGSTIGTIHGFCYAMLHEYHQRLNLSNDFTVAATIQSRHLQDSAINQLITTWEKDKPDALQSLVQHIVWEGGLDYQTRLYATILPLYEKLRATRWQSHGTIDFAASDEVITQLIQPILSDFLSDFDRIYSDLKRQKAILDYDDLQHLLADLLEKNTGVRKAIQKRYPYVLVDEFQDVSPIQRRLLENLHTSGQLFLVGDERQSIYGFRYADLHNFSEIQKKLSSSGGASLALTENYRSHPEIIAFLNSFQDQHQKELGEGDILGAPLVAKSSFAASREPAVQWLLTEAENSEAGRHQEAKKLAEKINQWAGKLTIANSAHRRYGQKIAYSDIAVLVRSSLSIPVLKSFFNQAGIPTITSASSGFYEQREIQDALSYLKVMVRPEDNLNCAAFLKSPYLQLTDAELFQLMTAAKSKEQSLFSSFKESQPDSWLFSIPAVDPATKVFSLLEKSFQPTGRSEQQLANLDKLKEQAQLWDEKAMGTVEEFVAMSMSMLRADVREMQAELSAKSEAVSILTVHAAKGLEFPIVIIADLNRQAGGGLPSIICNRHGQVGLRFRDPMFNTVDSKGYTEIAFELRQSERAEELRVFYVAASRAQQLLLLSSSVTPSGNRGWLKILKKDLS